MAATSFAWGSPSVRVLLADVSQGVVRIDGPHRGFVDGAPRFEAGFGLAWPFAANDGELLVDGRAVGRTLALEGSSGFVHDGTEYRGSVQLLARGDRVRVVNVLPLDDYLRGVVPAEMHASWPIEALKAQAIAARTYTLASLDPRADWDICATIDCQVYLGRDAEDPRADRAVADTRGLVLTYAGGFARTYYHADSGGTVASSLEVWGTRAPYLIAIRDVPASSPHRSWRIRMDAAAVGRSAAAAGASVGEVTRVRVLATSESGRVTSVEVVGTAGATVLSGFQLADALRGWGLKSTRFRMVGDLVAEGDGWGHGVGMSQYGARALAASGYAYWQILAFYYPGTALQRLP